MTNTEKATKTYTFAEVEILIAKAIKQDREFQARVLSNLPVLDSVTRQGWIEAPASLQGILDQLRPPQQSVEIQQQEEPIDYIIRVDRSVRPAYPDWVKLVMHPELENTGPAEYDLSKGVEQWLHNGQKSGKVIKGQMIYEYLKKEKILETCLSLRDGEEIRKKGIRVFRSLFQGKAVFLWKSVVQDRDGDLDVPYLYDDGDEVVVDWIWLDHDWDDGNPALRFARS